MYESDRGGLKELAVDIRDTNDHRHQSCMSCGSSSLHPLSYLALRGNICMNRKIVQGLNIQQTSNVYINRAYEHNHITIIASA